MVTCRSTHYELRYQKHKKKIKSLTSLSNGRRISTLGRTSLSTSFPYPTLILGFDLVSVGFSLLYARFSFLFPKVISTEEIEEAKLVFFLIFHKPYLISTALCYYRDVSFLYYACLLASYCTVSPTNTNVKAIE